MTGERRDYLEQMDKRLSDVVLDLRELRREMREGFNLIEGKIDGKYTLLDEKVSSLDTKLDGKIETLNSKIDRQLLWMIGTMIVLGIGLATLIMQQT